MAAIAERREAQLQALIRAAERRIEAGGLASLKMRDLAADIGCALGALYNLVEDMDDLILFVRAATMARLDRAVVEATALLPPATDAKQAEAEMVALALAYSRFAHAYRHLWRTLFEHRARHKTKAAALAQAQQNQIFQRIARPLRAKLPQARETDLLQLSRTLFSAVHGVVVISMEETLTDFPQDALERQIEKLIRLVSAGLDHRPSHK